MSRSDQRDKKAAILRSKRPQAELEALGESEHKRQRVGRGVEPVVLGRVGPDAYVPGSSSETNGSGRRDLEQSESRTEPQELPRSSASPKRDGRSDTDSDGVIVKAIEDFLKSEYEVDMYHWDSFDIETCLFSYPGQYRLSNKKCVNREAWELMNNDYKVDWCNYDFRREAQAPANQEGDASFKNWAFDKLTRDLVTAQMGWVELVPTKWLGVEWFKIPYWFAKVIKEAGVTNIYRELQSCWGRVVTAFEGAVRQDKVLRVCKSNKDIKLRAQELLTARMIDVLREAESLERQLIDFRGRAIKHINNGWDSLTDEQKKTARRHTN